MDDGHDTLDENQNTSEIEDMAETGDASINSADSADSEGSSEEAQSESGDQERDGRIDQSPLENSMIEIDMDDLGENQLHNTSSINQQLAIPNNFSKDVEDTDTRGRETLRIHQTLVQVGESRSSTTLELALLNQTEPTPPIFRTFTSPPNDGMCQSEQAIVYAPSSAELVDHTAGDLGLDLLQFLDTLDNTTSPVEEKLETA